jgi:hypothetical protein
MQELISEKEKLSPTKAAEILRNKEGLQGSNLGMGNEMAINQLLAHHGIILSSNKERYGFQLILTNWGLLFTTT